MIDKNEVVEEHKKLRIDIRNSDEKKNYHHFKVLSLQTYEDNKEQEIKGSNCKLLFHFIFKLIQENKDDSLSKMDWDIQQNPVQQLYLSKDTRRLMKVVNNFYATVYERQDVEKSEDANVAEEGLSLFGMGKNANKEPEENG